MSWDSHIDYLISHTTDASGAPHCDRAFIIRLESGAKLTTHGHANALKLTQAESNAIAACFSSKDFTPFMAGGIFVEGEQYQFLREEGQRIVFGEEGSGAITLEASKTAIVIGHCPEGSQQAYLNRGVAVIVDQLVAKDM